MKLGFIADVHADVHALQRALDLLEKLGADEILCAGDLVDFGHYPDSTLNLMRARGIPCVRGNHDRKLFTRIKEKFKPRHTDPAKLAPANLDYLRALPFHLTRQYANLALAVYHASPSDDQALVHPSRCTPGEMAAILRAAEVDVLVLGHTHRPIYVETDAGIIINPGSVLTYHNRRPPGTSSTFGLLDTQTRDYRLFDVRTGAPCTDRTWPWWDD